MKTDSLNGAWHVVGVGGEGEETLVSTVVGGEAPLS